MDSSLDQQSGIKKPYVHSQRFRIFNLTICLVAVMIVFGLFQFKVLDRVEFETLDFRYKLQGERQGCSDIVHIDIDEESIAQIGRWPWSRDWHASLITTLYGYQNKITAFDIFFSEPSPLIDFFLIESSRAANNVIYAIAFEYKKESASDSPYATDVLKRFTIDEAQIHGNKNLIPHFASPIAPLPDLYNTAIGAGHVNTIEDPDGTIRRAPTIIACKGDYYLHFALEITLKYLEIDPRDIIIVLGKHIDLGNGTKIPIDKHGMMLINWAGPWGKGFKHYSFWEVVSSYQKVTKGEEPLIPLSVFKDKICIIGLTATGLIDIKPVPLQSSYPIAGMHSNVIDTIVSKKFITEVKPPLNLILILALSLLIALVVPRFRPLNGLLFTILLVSLYFGLAFGVFKFLGLWISLIYPLTGVLISFIGIVVHSEIANAMDRMRLFHLAIEDGLTKLFVVRHFKEVLEQEMAKSLRYKRPLSLIISDIDHFKRINDTYGHLAGDFILKELANIMKSSCRESDMPARYGGEEFVMLLPETTREGAVEFAERLRKLVEGLTIEYNNVKFNITVSFGVAELKNEVAPADFIKRADEALYVAKETGRNKVCFG